MQKGNVKFELVINLKTTKTVGARMLLALVDEVID